MMKNTYVGLSMPNILDSVHLDENGRKYGSETHCIIFLQLDMYFS